MRLQITEVILCTRRLGEAQSRSRRYPNFWLISQFFSNLDLKIKHDYRLQDCAGWGGGWTHLWLMSPCFSNLDLQQNWGQETEAVLRTRIDFTRLCQFNIKRDYRLQDCARGGGGSNFGLMTHLFKSRSPDLRRLQITTLHAGGSHFWLNSPFC